MGLRWQSRDPKQPVKDLKPQVNLFEEPRHPCYDSSRMETSGEPRRAALAKIPCCQVTLKLTAVARQGVLEGKMRLKSTATASHSICAQEASKTNAPRSRN